MKFKMSEEEAKRLAQKAVALRKKHGRPTKQELEKIELEKLRVTFVFSPEAIQAFAEGKVKNPFAVPDLEEIRKIFKLKHHKIQECGEIIIGKS